MTRRTVWLLGLLAVTVLLALVAGTGGGGSAVGDAGARSVRRAGGGGAGDPAVPEEVVPVRTADLEDVQTQYEPGRDPFRFYQPPQPPPPPPPPPRDPEPRREPAPAPAPEPVPQGPQPPPVTFRFLGSFGPEERPIAVLADGDEIYNVRLGEVVDEKFRVVRIGYESVDLAFVDFPEEPAERLPVGRRNG